MHDDEVEEFGDPGIASKDAPVPGWLIATYIISPILGIIALILFWNGSHGWLDRGYWPELQRAANTTFPEIREKHPEFDYQNPPSNNK